jgi:hypothetical protein
MNTTQHNEKPSAAADKPAQSSALPWTVSDLAPYAIYANGRRIADCREANCICYTAEDQENARFIVHLANRSAQVLSALRGARAALRKALPFVPADSEAVFVGEWLDEISAEIYGFEKGAR